LKWLSGLRIEAADLVKPSALILLIANIVPLYGVLYLHWQVFPILLLFWLENVIVGVFNALKMLTAAGQWLTKIVMVPFFCFHYGMFTFVHGVFVFGLFGGYFTAGAPFPDDSSLFRAMADYHLVWAILALLASHAVSFAVNYVGKGEYRQAKLPELMGQPYGRVVLLHVTILFGGFVVMALGAPAIALMLLVLLKTYIDITTHVREHRKYRERRETAPGGAAETTG